MVFLKIHRCEEEIRFERKIKVVHFNYWQQQPYGNIRLTDDIKPKGKKSALRRRERLKIKRIFIQNRRKLSVIKKKYVERRWKFDEYKKGVFTVAIKRISINKTRDIYRHPNDILVT